MDSHQASLKHLSKDPVLRRVIKQAKLQPLQPRKNHFQSLVVSIINQQLSTKAADTIEHRFVDLFASPERSRRGGKFPKPSAILKKSDSALRKCGLSGSKVKYIKGLAKAVGKNELNFKKLSRAEDEEIISELIKLKGIGQWTAEMFLIFSLNRPNVFSVGDLGLRNAVKKLYKIDAKVHTKKMQKLLDSWHPHKSLASRHLWASLG